MTRWSLWERTGDGMLSLRSTNISQLLSQPCKLGTFFYTFQKTDVHIFSHSTLSLAKVNTYGLLYEWTGSDKSLKPILLAAHQGICVFRGHL
jgi:hypothetical protein